MIKRKRKKKRRREKKRTREQEKNKCSYFNWFLKKPINKTLRFLTSCSFLQLIMIKTIKFKKRIPKIGGAKRKLIRVLLLLLK